MRVAVHYFLFIQRLWTMSAIRRGRIIHMGLFDKMFGKGATDAQQQPNAEQRFQELKQKYQTALSVVEQQQIQVQNLHVQDDKLFIRGIAPSQEVANKVW